jgi:hypothetical protein
LFLEEFVVLLDGGVSGLILVNLPVLSLDHLVKFDGLLAKPRELVLQMVDLIVLQDSASCLLGLLLVFHQGFPVLQHLVLIDVYELPVVLVVHSVKVLIDPVHVQVQLVFDMVEGLQFIVHG